MDQKRLYKARGHRMGCGVCGGIAEYFNTDPTVIRLIAVIIMFCTAFVPFLIGYAICAAIIPDAPA